MAEVYKNLTATKNITQILDQIKTGIVLELPIFKYSTPELMVCTWKPKLWSLKAGGCWFPSLSKLVDLSGLDTNSINLHTNGIIWPEDDMDMLENEIFKNIKEQSVEVYPYDKSFPNKFYKKVQKIKKSGNYIHEFNFFTHCVEYITADLLYPILEHKKKFNYAILKLPTCSGEGVVDLVYLYSMCYEKVTVLKHKRDSWLKDSFILVCHGAKHDTIEPIKTKLRQVYLQKNIDISKTGIHLFNHLDIDRGFREVWRTFVDSIHHIVYITHGLLFRSVTNAEQSVNNEFNIALKEISKLHTGQPLSKATTVFLNELFKDEYELPDNHKIFS